MATLRELKGRIGSVASSEKITGAMKMISSAKMHKAELILKQLVPFRRQIETIIGNLLSADASFSSPLLETREIRHVTIVVWGSDDGLCGAYNMNISKQIAVRLSDLRQSYGNDIRVDILTVGRKIEKASRRFSSPTVTVQSLEGVDSKCSDSEVKRFTTELVDRFLNRRTDAVDLLYMNFKSVARQQIQLDRLLPVTQDLFASAAGKASGRPYIFEPDAPSIFASVLPLFLLSVTQEVFCENRASEQAARVMAMQSANDNAKKLLEQLRLEYNKLRQQSITTELLDIVGGQVR